MVGLPRPVARYPRARERPRWYRSGSGDRRNRLRRLRPRHQGRRGPTGHGVARRARRDRPTSRGEGAVPRAPWRRGVHGPVPRAGRQAGSPRRTPEPGAGAGVPGGAWAGVDRRAVGRRPAARRHRRRPNRRWAHAGGIGGRRRRGVGRPGQHQGARARRRPSGKHRGGRRRHAADHRLRHPHATRRGVRRGRLPQRGSGQGGEAGRSQRRLLRRRRPPRAAGQHPGAGEGGDVHRRRRRRPSPKPPARLPSCPSRERS